MKVDLELGKKLGLTEKEYNTILNTLGRSPSFTELGVYSVMWSEHCSYKSSKKLLKTFPKKSDRLLAEPGAENAGALSVDDKWAVVFKVESHNHPSAISPFQGAATGVGGILRDIFAMGARPIALLDSLRFGELDDRKNKYLFEGVVSGISHYGNCIGVPVVGGEIEFEKTYSTNPLVNVMCVGIVEKDKLTFAKADKVGAKVIYVGAATGRDGIHGATFASVELTENSEQDLPSVQIGDPFLEKLLLEATLEIVEKDLAVAIQDMGAAGLTSSSTEMAHSGSVGMKLDLDKVPLREKDMTPYEMLLSESQERMLIVAREGREQEMEAVLEKWGLHFAEIGETTEDGNFVCYFRGEKVTEIPLESIVGKGVPVSEMLMKRPDDASQKITKTPSPDSINEVFEAIVDMPQVASKRYVFRQYDHQVGTNTVVLPGSDSGVVRLKDSEKLLSMSIDCRGSYNYLDPYEGGKIAVAESIRNVVATGARPIGITDCLNYGNPNKPEIYWTFSEGVRGISDVCDAFEIPVTGGNVSFYNESPNGAVFPSPVIGTVGIIEHTERILTPEFKAAGDIVIIVGETKDEIGGSLYQKYLSMKYNDVEYPSGDAPILNLDESKRNAEFIIDANDQRLLESCHDLSDGGLMLALAESAILSDAKFGVEMEMMDFAKNLREDIFLMSETQSRYLISTKSDRVESLQKLARQKDVPIFVIGKTIHEQKIRGMSKEIDINKISGIYNSSLEKKLKQE